MYKFSPVADAWTAIAPIPASSTGVVPEGGCFFSASYKGKIMIMSLEGLSINDTTDLNTIYVYDPTTDSWTLYENANPVSSRGTPVKGQNGSKAYYGCGDDFIHGLRNDFWEIDLAAFFTGLQKQNPGLEDIKVYTDNQRVNFSIPIEISLKEDLSVDLYNLNGQVIYSSRLNAAESIDISKFSTGNYIYLIKSAGRNLKSGRLIF